MLARSCSSRALFGPKGVLLKFSSNDRRQVHSTKGATYVDGLNVKNALDKEHESKSFGDIIALPPSALQGLTEEGADKLFEKLGITTIHELAEWHHFRIARAIVVLAEREEHGGRAAGSAQSVDAAVDAPYAGRSLAQLAASPVTALRGIGPKASAGLKRAGVLSVRELAEWRFPLWAEAFSALARLPPAPASPRQTAAAAAAAEEEAAAPAPVQGRRGRPRGSGGVPAEAEAAPAAVEAVPAEAAAVPAQKRRGRPRGTGAAAEAEAPAPAETDAAEEEAAAAGEAAPRRGRGRPRKALAPGEAGGAA